MSLTVRRENLPVRCEICHQTDLFNPETGNCLRCSVVALNSPLVQTESEPVPKPDVTAIVAQNQRRMAISLGCASGLIGIEIFLQFLDLFDVIQLPKIGPVWGLLLLPLAQFTAIVWILGIKFGRCPNCRCNFPLNLDRAAKNCRNCGARLMP